MTDPISTGARSAAQRLTAQHGTGLATAVEQAPQGQRSPTTYLDPTALGSLIVSAATLAWTIYNNLHAKTDRPPPPTSSRAPSATRSAKATT